MEVDTINIMRQIPDGAIRTIRGGTIVMVRAGTNIPIPMGHGMAVPNPNPVAVVVVVVVVAVDPVMVHPLNDPVKTPIIAGRVPMGDIVGIMGVQWGVNGVILAIKTMATPIRWSFALSSGRNGAVSGTMSAGFVTLSLPTPKVHDIG